jgi:molybdopterin synthase sulfur carrier subunit
LFQSQTAITQQLTWPAGRPQGWLAGGFIEGFDMIVRFFAYIRDYTKCKETEMDGCTDIDMLLQRLCERFGGGLRRKVFKGEALSDEIIILVNGRHISHLDGTKTKLEEKDEVSIFPVVAGG